jgi:dipeptidyl-peptidase-3
MELVKHTEGDTTKTYLKINDYTRLRDLFATLLAEIQRIKSEGDLEAARNIVETYGVKLNPELHKEILDRYEHLNIAPYKGFLNPRLTLVKEGETVKDVTVSYDETLDEQMLRYSRVYSV